MSGLSLSELFPAAFHNDSSLQKSLGEEFSLCENGNLVFHWADFHETCDVIGNLLETDPTFKEEFHKKEFALNRLTLIPVWIRTQSKVHQTTMFEMYERYILNQTQLSLGVDPTSPIDISFISSTGPFRTMAIAECFNKSTYKDFVMTYLLKGKLPKRDFRIRLKAKVLMEYGQEFSQASLVQLEQLTTQGMLLSVDSDFYAKTISKESSVRILLNTDVLRDCLDKDLTELKNHLSQYAFNLMYSSKKEDALTCQVSDCSKASSFDFLKSKKVYLFISYSKLTSETKDHVKSIQGFITHTRKLIREYYGQNASKKSA